MIRQACGTRMGSILHIEHTEQLCGTCEHAERVRSLVAEQKRPTPERKPIPAGVDLQPLIAALATLFDTPKDGAHA